MTDEEFDAERARILTMWERWEPLLGLDAWDMDIQVYDGPYVSPAGSVSGEAVGTCVARWQYQHATLQFNARLSRDLDDAALDTIVVHEAVHVLLHELRPAAVAVEDWMEHEEHATTMLARAMMRIAGRSPRGPNPHDPDE